VTNTKKFVVALLGAVAMAAAPAAMAQKSRSTASPWYVGLHVGQSDIDELNDTDTAVRILGGYRFHQHLAVEVAYTDFGTVQGVKGNAFEVDAVGSWPLADRFSIYGKLGFARGEFKNGTSEDSIELTYGLGVQYDFMPNIGARLEWQQYPDVGDGASDVDVISIGVVYRF
jgi:opacity protein-like surface antigen